MDVRIITWRSGTDLPPLIDAMRHLTLLITAFLVLTAEATYCELTAEWILLAEEDNIRVLKKAEVEGRETPFKAEAKIDASVEQVLNIILDFERKPEWSPKCEKVTIIRKNSDFDYFVKEKYLTPWPVRDRDQQGRSYYNCPFR